MEARLMKETVATAELPTWFVSIYPMRYCSKRTLDICAALALLVFSAPAMLLIAIALWLSKQRPVIFSQTRVGQYGSRFVIYKFATMTTRLAQETYVVKDDPRVTRLGRILRPPHLDELPQLWNVLRGDMSMVGPRPRTVDDTEELLRIFPDYQQRMAIKPGLTGL